MSIYKEVFDAAHMNKEVSKSNRDKLNALSARLKNAEIVSLLDASSVSAADFSLAIYTCEKTIKFHSFVAKIDRDFCDNLNAAFRTCMLCAVNEVTVTERDIAASILLDVEVSDERKHLVFQRARRISADAQRQYVIAALRQMKIIEEVSKHEYRVNLNASAIAMCNALSIDVSAVETESA